MDDYDADFDDLVDYPSVLYRRRVSSLGPLRYGSTGMGMRRQSPLYTNPRMNGLLHGRRYVLDDDGWEDDDEYEMDGYDDEMDSMGYLDLDDRGGGGSMSGFENFYDVSRDVRPHPFDFYAFSQISIQDARFDANNCATQGASLRRGY
jgi:hypothetical protein